MKNSFFYLFWFRIMNTLVETYRSNTLKLNSSWNNFCWVFYCFFIRKFGSAEWKLRTYIHKTMYVCYLSFILELFYFIAHKHDNSSRKTFVMNSTPPNDTTFVTFVSYCTTERLSNIYILVANIRTSNLQRIQKYILL